MSFPIVATCPGPIEFGARRFNARHVVSRITHSTPKHIVLASAVDTDYGKHIVIVRHERHVGRPDEVDNRQIVVVIDRTNAGFRRFTQFFYNTRWVGHGFQYEFTDRLLAFADSCLAVIDEFIFFETPEVLHGLYISQAVKG